MHIAICDDEPAQAQQLARSAQQWAREHNIAATVEQYHSAEAFLFARESSGCDVLLLDIQMPGKSGMELARQIREMDQHIAIVFVTSYADHISEGYDVAALHYLMKPVHDEKLFTVLDRAFEALSRVESALLLECDGQVVCLRQRDILYAEAFSPIVRVQTTDGTYECRMSFSDLINQLEAGRFVRCHRSYIVGLVHVRRITRTDVVLEDGVVVPLARREYDAVHQAFIRYHKEGR